MQAEEHAYSWTLGLGSACMQMQSSPVPTFPSLYGRTGEGRGGGIFLSLYRRTGEGQGNMRTSIPIRSVSLSDARKESRR